MAKKITIAQALRHPTPFILVCDSYKRSETVPAEWLSGLALPKTTRLDQIEKKLRCDVCNHIGGEIYVGTVSGMKGRAT